MSFSELRDTVRSRPSKGVCDFDCCTVCRDVVCVCVLWGQSLYVSVYVSMYVCVCVYVCVMVLDTSAEGMRTAV